MARRVAALFCCVASASAALSPVVIIPGDGGSQLEAKAVDGPGRTVPHFYCEKAFDWSRLWLNTPSLLPGLLDCWANNVALTFDSDSDSYSSAPGVEVRVPGFGDTATIEYLDPAVTSVSAYMAPLVNDLVAAGLVRGHSVRGAPYDFRLSPRSDPDYIARLASLVEETYALNSNTPVTIVSHSMGCLVALYFLESRGAEWTSQYIHAWVPLSGVWGGTTKVLRLQISGDAFGIPGVNPLSVRSEQRSYESNAWLMPTPALWGDQVLVSTPSRNYTANDAQELYADAGFAIGYRMRQLVATLTSALKAPTVPVYCVYGTGVATEESYVYSSGFPNMQPTIVTAMGDGIVNARSLSLCNQWPNSKVLELLSIDHAGVVSAKQTFDLLRAVITLA